MSYLSALCYEAHKTSREHGFWEYPDFTQHREAILLSKLALIVSEVGEAVEAVRVGDVENFTEELADICIRVFDLAEHEGMDLHGAILDKMAGNKGRPYKHGKQA